MHLLFFLLLQTDSTQIIQYHGKKVIYNLQDEQVIIQDSAQVKYGDITLQADTVIYYLKSNSLDAYPRCALNQGNDTVVGTFLHYNVKNKKALMKNGKSRIDKGFFYGQEVYWVKEKTFNVNQGRYTTCDESIPHYYFYAPRMKVLLNDMVIAEPIFLCVRGIPLIAAPFWFVPIARQRKSGLLPFKVGSSESEGKFLKQFAYYWVINDYSDLTFMIDIMEKKGLKPQVEGVWVYKPYTAGNILASYIDETDTQHRRYAVSGRTASDKFFLGTNMSANLDFASDASYIPDYSVEKELWLKKEATSNITISRPLPFGTNSIYGYRKQDFEKDRIDEYLPRYSITTTAFSLFGLLSTQANGLVVRERSVRADTITEHSALGINSSPSVTRNILGLFSVSPSINLDWAMFDRDRFHREYPSRFAYSLGAVASSNLYRVFSFDGLGLHGILHKLSPSLSYNYTPDFDFRRFYPVSGIANYSYQNNAGFGLSNEFEGKVGKDRIKKRLFGINAASGFNFKSDSFSVVSLNFDTYYNFFPPPCTSFTLRLTTTVNPYNYDYSYTVDNSFQLKIKEQSLTIGQNYSRNGRYQVSGQLNIKPTRKWTVTAAMIYNVTDHEIVSRSFGLSRDLHCWEGVFTFNTLGSEWVYDFMIKIKAIPEISVGRGTLGFLLP